MTDKEIKKYFSKLGLQFLWTSLIIFAVQIVALLIIDRAAPALLANDDMYLVASMLPMYLIAYPLAALLIKRLPAVPVPRHRMEGKELLFAFCIGYEIIFLSNVAGLGITYGIGVLKGSPVQNLTAEIVSEINPATAMVFMVILAPVAEEYLFRKLLMDRLAVFGEGTAIFFSGLLFGLFHGNLNQFIYAFFLGMYLGFIYIKTGMLRYNILLHMGINFIGSISGPFVLDAPEFVLIVYGIVIFVLVIAGMILGVRNRQEFQCDPGELVIPKGHRFSITFLNLGMILYTLFWIIQILLQVILS